MHKSIKISTLNPENEKNDDRKRCPLLRIVSTLETCNENVIFLTITTLLCYRANCVKKRKKMEKKKYQVRYL